MPIFLPQDSYSCHSTSTRPFTVSSPTDTVSSGGPVDTDIYRPLLLSPRRTACRSSSHKTPIPMAIIPTSRAWAHGTWVPSPASQSGSTCWSCCLQVRQYIHVGGTSTAKAVRKTTCSTRVRVLADGIAAEMGLAAPTYIRITVAA